MGRTTTEHPPRNTFLSNAMSGIVKSVTGRSILDCSMRPALFCNLMSFPGLHSVARASRKAFPLPYNTTAMSMMKIRLQVLTWMRKSKRDAQRYLNCLHVVDVYRSGGF